MPENFDKDYKALLRPFGPRLWLTSAFAAGVSVWAVALLGLSGWFLTAAAVAGAGGPVAVQAFNYLLPSAFIRFFAIGRTVLRYGERYLGHSAALRAMADLRPALFARLLGQRRGALMRLSRGEASSRFVQDVGALENRLVAQSAPASAAGGVVMALLMCGWASPWGALILLAFMAAALGAALYIHRRLPEADAASEQAAIGALTPRSMRFHCRTNSTAPITRNAAKHTNDQLAIEPPRKVQSTLVQSPLPRKIIGMARCSGKCSIIP